jgi:hypothetical protein
VAAVPGTNRYLGTQYRPTNNNNNNNNHHHNKKAVLSLKRLVAGFPPRRPGFEPGSGKWDLWWTKWGWGRFSPSTSVSPANLHSAQFSIITISRGGYNRPVVADAQSGPSSIPTMRIKKQSPAQHGARICTFCIKIITKTTL